MKMGDEFFKNAPIYYIDKEGNHWPGKVIDIRIRIKVKINHLQEDKEMWVTPANLELQYFDFNAESSGQ
jgi:hypothetical protein